MHKITMLCASALVFGALPAVAQEQQLPRFVYEAYSQVSDLDQWNRFYRQHSVPVLRQLQEEGVIQGWSMSQHHTGGEYNSRLAIRTYDWSALDTFWSEYFSRIVNTVPAETFSAWQGLVQAHRDEIWNFGVINVADRPVNYMYQAAFNIGFADLGAWNTAFAERTRPVLDELMEEGLLGGYVVFNHNTGESHNWKMLYLFEDWDRMDDCFQQLSARMNERYPDAAQTQQLIRSHADDLWVPVPADSPGG
jgi:hypothetical protein